MEPYSEFLDSSPAGIRVRGFLHRSPAPSTNWVVLTHGAGSNCQSPLLKALAEAFAASGRSTLRCDLPFRQLRPVGPPRRESSERDQDGLRAAVEAARREGAVRVSLGGHSYGGRQASLVAAADPALATALLLLSYPLHPPKRLAELRTKHFPNLKTPALFVHGTRDGFGSIPEMNEAIALISAKTELLVVPNAGHELLRPGNRAELPTLITKALLSIME